MKTIVILLILGFSNCATNNSYSKGTPTNTTPLTNHGTVRQVQTPSDIVPPERSEFTVEDGLVVFRENYEEIQRNSGLIRIYDESGKEWKTIDYNDDSVDAMDEPGGSFRPFWFRTGHFRLQFRCTGRSKDWFAVVVQGETPKKVVKYVKAEDPLFEYKTWQQWVLDHDNIRFDTEKTQVLKSINGKKVAFNITVDTFIIAEEVRGEWAKIRWAVPDTDDFRKEDLKNRFPENFGWIRWREGERTKIWEFYL